MIHSSPFDPIELELMRNLFEAAAEEMGIVLQRVAFSANIKERRDFSCAIFTADARLVAQAAHIPVHLGSMGESVAVVIERLGNLRDGDAAIVNDPFAGGTHLPDITIVSPVYCDGTLAAYVANRAHHADVGGVSPGSMTLSRHIDEEGVRIEPLILNAEVLQRLLDAARTPDERRGDIEAQLAANHAGATAVKRIVHRRGVEQLQHYGNRLIEYSRAFMRRAISEIPDGEYAFADVMDDDGAENGPINIRARVTIAGDRAVVDLTACDNQVPGCINCPAAVARSAVYYCFACLLDESVPLNAGIFVDVLTRPGSVVHALYPAAVVAGNTEASQRIVDVVMGALSQAIPSRIPAASCGTMSSVAFGGLTPSSGTPGEAPGEGSSGRAASWTYYETIGGGCGAGPGWHGESTIQCQMTNTLCTPAEALELQYPLRVARFERARNTGGAGAFRGGDGIVREIEALEDCEGTILGERRISRPYGLHGGGPGHPATNSIIAGDSTPRHLPGKCRFNLRPGERLQVITPGGGGWGAA
jgi:N-methylhydantoinase B